eukprot:scaffold651_cov284-Prasinococcus_capsulatus_cf.AAC.4
MQAALVGGLAGSPGAGCARPYPAHAAAHVKDDDHILGSADGRHVPGAEARVVVRIAQLRVLVVRPREACRGRGVAAARQQQQRRRRRRRHRARRRTLVRLPPRQRTWEVVEEAVDVPEVDPLCMALPVAREPTARTAALVRD